MMVREPFLEGIILPPCASQQLPCTGLLPRFGARLLTATEHCAAPAVVRQLPHQRARGGGHGAGGELQQRQLLKFSRACGALAFLAACGGHERHHG